MPFPLILDLFWPIRCLFLHDTNFACNLCNMAVLHLPLDFCKSFSLWLQFPGYRGLFSTSAVQEVCRSAGGLVTPCVRCASFVYAPAGMGSTWGTGMRYRRWFWGCSEGKNAGHLMTVEVCRGVWLAGEDLVVPGWLWFCAFHLSLNLKDIMHAFSSCRS